MSAQVAMTMDVPASILAAAGVRAPAGYRPDGIDLLPTLRGQAPLVERRLFWRWVRPDREQRAARVGGWKLLVDGAQTMLFDLTKDPGERTDLAARRPDLVAQLGRLIAEWEDDVGRAPGGR